MAKYALIKKLHVIFMLKFCSSMKMQNLNCSLYIQHKIGVICTWMSSCKKEIKRVQSRVQQKINMRYFYVFFLGRVHGYYFLYFWPLCNPKILITVDKTTFEVHEIINSNVLFYFPKAYCAKTVQWVKMFSKRVYILSSTKLHFHDIITLV